jgi:hypothetical protein
MDRIDPAEPIDKMEPAEPIDRIDPEEPSERSDPAEPLALLALPVLAFAVLVMRLSCQPPGGQGE